MKLHADMVNRLRALYQGRGVCVTGGAGFIGSHLCDVLLSVGASLTVIDDLSNSTLEHLAGLIDLEPERVRFVHGSILDDDALADAIEGAQTVFHLAALGSVPRSVEDPQRTWAVNATGTLRVLEAARARGQAGPDRIVFAASSSAYGDHVGEPRPKVETQPPMPMSPYAASKVAGEDLMSSWARTYGMSTVSLRYFNVFGPRQSADSAYAAAIPAFIKKLSGGQSPIVFGDGQQTRDFTFVGNAVLATLLAGRINGTKDSPLAGEVINIGTGRRTTIAELARALAQRMGCPDIGPTLSSARTGDVRHSLADITKARQVLGYEPFMDLDAGLAETIEWAKRGVHAAH